MAALAPLDDTITLGQLDVDPFPVYCRLRAEAPVCRVKAAGRTFLTKAQQLAKKVANLRIFSDDAGKMNKSLLDVGGDALIVSQFTLAADTSRGNRPGFSAAAHPDLGKALYQDFCRHVGDFGITVATGEFGADMKVTLTNDGPVTIWLEV